jgi:hypothetical protein
MQNPLKEKKAGAFVQDGIYPRLDMQPISSRQLSQELVTPSHQHNPPG